jgi:type II secretory pathway component PulF
MARFIYTVQDAQGTVTTGAMDSDDEDGAVQALQTKGLFILSIQSESAKSKGILNLKKPGGGSVSGRDLVFFGEQMATLLGGGIPLVRALSLLSEHADNKAKYPPEALFTRRSKSTRRSSTISGFRWCRPARSPASCPGCCGR